MLRVRTVGDVADFVGVPGDPDDYADSVTALWESGAGRPSWCFVLERHGSPVGRIGFRVAPTTSDPAFLGTLPPEELFAYGWYLPWTGDAVDLGHRMFRAAAESIADDVPEMLELRINAELHPHPYERCDVAEACGMALFQEKQGFYWVDDGRPVAVPDRLAFRPLDDVGIDAYRAVMAPCGRGTLDRNDRYYWGGTGPQNWAAQMTEYLDDADAPMWLLGYADGTPVGYVAVSRADDWGSTIAHIGVVPEHRGNGYVHDLLAAGTAAAQRAGIGTMLSDVDVLNTPMIGAMRRAGHHDDRRPWHLWVYRTALQDLSDVRQPE